MEKKKQKNAATWSACKAVLNDWPAPGVVALLQELYQLSDENRTFLHGRLLPSNRQQILDGIKQKLKSLVSQSNVFANRFSHSGMKKLVDQYQKATGDIAGAAELLIADIDYTLTTFDSFGGGDEKMVDHVYACMERVEKALESLAPELLPPVVDQLYEVGRRWRDRLGWGLSDELWGQADSWEKKVAATPQPPPAEKHVSKDTNDDWPQ